VRRLVKACDECFMKCRPLLQLCILLLCAAGPAFSTMVPRFSLEELATGSDLIVHGKVLRTWTAWDAATQIIWTHSEVQVIDALKGSPQSAVVVSEPGGSVDDVTMAISGMPRYQPGEEVVLFLFQTPVGLWRARGLGQGKFLVTESASGVRTVRPAPNGALVVEPIGGKPTGGTDLRQLRGMRLEDFESRVRAAALLRKGTN